MNNHSIAFITCVNDEKLYEECIRYIDKLNVPSGYNIEKIAIRGAKSAASAYNQIISTCDSKYKVYLHQDTFIINKNFILDSLKIFNLNEKVGMIGVVGAEGIPTSGIWWESKRKFGKVYESSTGSMKLLDFENNENSREYAEVQAVDGLIMMTQYDLKWRDDVFDGWHFYDTSQSVEFENAGYKVVIPEQKQPWCLHDSGVANIENGYEQYRQKFLKVYSKDLFPLVSILVSTEVKLENFEIIFRNVVNQTYRNIEIIVMGIESNKEVLKDKINDDAIFYLSRDQLTINENIDRALFDAKGDYFYIVNTDEFMNENKIEKMMKNIIGADFSAVIDGYKFENMINYNNYVNIINGKDACNYIINNFEKFLGNNISALINRKFYNNKYGSFKSAKFEYISHIATLTNCLRFGDLLLINDKLHIDCCNNNLNWKSTVLCIQEMLNLSECLKNEKFFNDSDEFDKLISRITEYSKVFIDNINNLNSNEKDGLFSIINERNKNLINKYEFNFKYIGNNIEILENAKFYASEGMIIEDNVSILENATFMLPYWDWSKNAEIVVKKGCSIGKRIFVSATNKIIIENDVIIASNVHITDHNHEYEKIGIPIMKQGVTSFTNEVVIGAGSWIANGCVIVGNVKIGRGCVIGANSVVLDDIPDYCVAAGNPAKVKKYFDKISGKWVKVNDNWNMEEYNNKIKNMKPLLTIGIPTYNRSYFLERCLDNIFRQIGNDSIVEVLVSDNASSDATQKVVEKYKQEYKNLRYNRNSRNLGLMGNTRKVYELAKGVFINAHGDDDYYNDDVIYNIVDIIYKNIDSSIIYTLPQTGAYSIQNGYGIDEYLKIISFMTTFVTGLIIKNDKYTDIQDKTKYDGTELDLVYFQMELLKNREKFTVMHGKILNSESGQHRQTGNPYNFGKVFIEYYLNILMKYIDNGLELQTFKDEKVKLINNMIIPWVNSICNNQAELGINNFEEIFTNYFKDEPYFEEKFKIIKHILDKKVSC